MNPVKKNPRGGRGAGWKKVVAGARHLRLLPACWAACFSNQYVQTIQDTRMTHSMKMNSLAQPGVFNYPHVQVVYCFGTRPPINSSLGAAMPCWSPMPFRGYLLSFSDRLSWLHVPLWHWLSRQRFRMLHRFQCGHWWISHMRHH